MVAGIAIDLAIVVVLELQRGVVEDAVARDWSVLQGAHIGFSSLAVVLYFPTLWYGFLLKRGKAGPGRRRLHRNVATTALVARTIGFACMWSV